MRTARIKVDETNTWYHCYNRVCGSPDWYPFRDKEKEMFVRILKEVCILFGIKVVSYQVMSNHYHLLVHAPVEPLGKDEMCARYETYYQGDKTLDPDSEECEVWRQRSRDVSWFMRMVQQKFTMWYNRTRTAGRRGKLWSDRFKHTIVESGSALWSCWKYVENNAVRAGMEKDAADYRFCSYGVWCQSGCHPFMENITSLVMPLFGCADAEQLREMLCMGLGKEYPDNKSKTCISQTVTRRVRYWTQGLVIGSELFVRKVMAQHYHRAKTKRLAKGEPGEAQLFAWRILKNA